MALIYDCYKSGAYGASAGSADPYFNYNAINSSGYGANQTATPPTECYITNANTNGSSANGYRLDIEVKLAGGWYVIGYIEVDGRISTHSTLGTTPGNTQSRFVWIGSAQVLSLMGKYQLESMRGKATAGYFHIGSNSRFYMVAAASADYTAPGAPTNLQLSAQYVAPGAAATLSWNAGAPGNANPIKEYQVHVSSAANGTYTYLGTTAATNMQVTAPTTNGSTYYYRVVSVGTVPGWYSGYSESSPALMCYYTQPTAPTAVNVSTNMSNPGAPVTLSWSGATAGTNNPIAQYYIFSSTDPSGQYSKIGEVSAPTTSTAVTTSTTQGAIYYYKVASIGVYANSWPSDAIAYIRTNVQPAQPTFVFPQSGAATFSKIPSFKVNVPAEPDGQLQTLEYRLNASAWESLGNVSADGGVHTFYINVPTGAHTISTRTKDSMGLYGPEQTISFTIHNAQWSRTLGTGTVFAGPTVSGRTDLIELRDAINSIRYFVGLPGISLPGLGQWAYWKICVESLQAGFREAYLTGGKADVSLPTVPIYPTAAFLNQLRNLVEVG